MKITPTYIALERSKEQGTGMYDKKQIFPCTDILLNKLNVDLKTRLEIKQKQKDILDNLDVPQGLRQYQTDDVKFLARRKCAACFNEQRTGKTPTALVTMRVKNIKKLLIVAPTSTLYTWARECRQWFSDTAPITVVDGTAKKREQLIKNWKTGVLIISYECIRESTHKTRDEFGCIESIELKGDLAFIRQYRDIDGCILDEAHRIKNHKSKQAKALFSLSWIPNKLALTGTPAPGKQHEIYSILHWLYPQIFTGYWRFIDYYFTQTEQYVAGGSFQVIGNFKPNKAQELQQFLDVISTCRKRKDVMQWLPDKDKQIIKLEQTKEQKEYIQELKSNFEIEGTEVDAVNILSQLIKTRQILLSPKLLDLKTTSQPKIDWIKQYIKDYPDKSIIIFSNFTEWLKLLGKELECEDYIIGEVSKVDRTNIIDKFQKKQTKLLLINIKAGKEGITLDTADVAIFTDKYPPIGDILQAEDRFVATTKDKLNTGCTIIDLVMENSYEENILSLLDTNASAVDVVNNYVEYLKGGET